MPNSTFCAESGLKTNGKPQPCDDDIGTPAIKSSNGKVIGVFLANFGFDVNCMMGGVTVYAVIYDALEWIKKTTKI